MVMQTMPQAVPATNASATPGTLHSALPTAQPSELSSVKILYIIINFFNLFPAQ